MHWKETHIKTSHDPYAVDPSVLKALYNLDDGRLRIRWSQRQQQWAIERKIGRVVNYIPTLGHYRTTLSGQVVENDSWIRAREGLVCVGYIPPRPAPGQWLIKNLEYYRIERWGGADALSRVMDAAEESKAAQQLREQRQRWQDIAGETWESYCWEGHRVAVPGNYKAH